MISSMTGYGKAIVELPGKKLNIEIKSLNSKALDLSVKVPGIYRDKEVEIRTLLSQELQRGKIDFYISSDATADAQYLHINKDLVLSYYKELIGLQKELGINDPGNLLPVILKMPDVLKEDVREDEESDWPQIYPAIVTAVSLVKEFRLHEGSLLEQDMINRIGLILEFLTAVGPFEEKRITDIRERIRTGFQNLSKAENMSVKTDENRFEQELIYYLERLDITEEKVRLQKHCDYFIETIHGDDYQGKKLGFVAQEIGREINTIGSKANDAEIQKIVVQMKDELEKIKEQLGNIL